MSLPLVTRFGADPLLDLEVANKRYVDSSGGGGTQTTQEDALSGNFSTTSTSITDITGLTLTVPTRTGGKFYIHLDCMTQNSGSGANRTGIENGVGNDEELMGTASLSANDRTHVGVASVGDLDGRVIQGRAFVGSGSGSWSGSGNSNTTLRVIESGGS